MKDSKIFQMAKVVATILCMKAEIIRCNFWIQQEPISNILIKLVSEAWSPSKQYEIRSSDCGDYKYYTVI
jgi:hypothetical protein